MPDSVPAFVENQLGKKVPTRVLEGTTRKVVVVVSSFKVAMRGIIPTGFVANSPVITLRSVPAKMVVVCQNQIKDCSITIKLHPT